MEMTAIHKVQTISHKLVYWESVILLQAMLGSAGLGDDDSSKHKDLNWAEVLKDDDVVQCMMSALENFINPFTMPDKDHLY